MPSAPPARYPVLVDALTPEVLTNTPSGPTRAPRGRPSEYRPEYCQMLLDHFANRPLEQEKCILTEKVSSDPDRSFKQAVTQSRAGEIPSFEGFAWSIGVPASTLAEWEKRYPDFRDARARARDYQKHWLMANGAWGNIAPPTFVFLATNCTDMVNKSTVEVAEPAPAALKEKTPEELEAMRVHLEAVKAIMEGSAAPADK